VGKMDGEVRRQLKLNWVGRNTVNVRTKWLTLGYFFFICIVNSVYSARYILPRAWSLQL
jgi:hypothetical protein